MAPEKARLPHGKRILIGFGLVALFWFLFAFFAFVPFGRQTPALLILSVTTLAFIAIVVVLRKLNLVDLISGLYSVLAVALLVGLYMIPIRSNYPAEALALNEELSADHDDKYEYARQLFWIINDRFTGPTREYLLQPLKIFVIKNGRYFWETGGYVPSHIQAQIFRHLLLQSGRFQEDEVHYETGRCFNSPHGFVVIEHPDRKIYADLWAAENFDEYRFGQVVDMPSCDGLSATPEGEPYIRPAEEARRGTGWKPVL